MHLLKMFNDLIVAYAVVFQRAALEEAPVNEWQIVCMYVCRWTDLATV